MRISAASLAVSIACLAGSALAQSPTYPAKPVRLVLGPGPGSVAD